MYDPLATGFDPRLSSRTRFTEDDAPTLLYGLDPTERVVAIEPYGSNEIILYKRETRGRTITERRVTQPWLITTNKGPYSNRADATILDLRGEHPFRYLVTFASWESYRNATAGDSFSSSTTLGPSSLVAQYLIRSGLTLFKGMEFPDIKRMQIDLETLSLDPSEPEAGIIMISIRQGVFEEVLVLESTEAELIERLNRVMATLDPDVIEGHNVYGFDFPYLIDRARRAGVNLRLGRDGSGPRVVDTNRRQPTVFINGRHIIDTYQQIQRFDVQGNLTRYGLKEVVRQMGLEREDRVFVDRATIAEMWKNGERDRDTLAAYALDDVRDVDMLSRVITPTEFYQTQILPTTYQRSANTGTGRKIDELMMRTYIAAGHSLPRRERARPYPGGYVELIQAGVFSPVVKCDVESLYPSIMLTKNIAAKTDVLGAFPLLLRDLTNRRINAKRQVAQTTGEDQATWQGLQSSFKILINSFYGYLGFGAAQFNDYEAAEQVTIEGQRLIQKVVQLLQELHAEPIEVDTDGVYFSPPGGIQTELDEERFIQQISNRLPAGIRLAHDGRYRHMLSLKQKTYALIDYEGNLSLTGSSLRSRALESCFLTLIRDIARALMEEDIDAAKGVYFALAEAIQSRSLPIEEISQWTMLREDKIASRTRVNALLNANPGRWKYGERLAMYERNDGKLGLSEDYDNDENTTFLLRRLRDVAERFAPALDDQPTFEATFPLLKPTTDLRHARMQEPTRQLGLF